MPIKQIQLRGISRNPSDRSTADGGCAESINFQVLEQELAPAVTPKDISSELGLWENNEGYKVLYIHKTTRIENLIILKKETILNPSVVGYSASSAFSEIVALEFGESISGITSVGNTIVLSTSTRTHYILWDVDNSAYVYLGTKIPMPKISVINSSVTGSEEGVVFNQNAFLYITDISESIYGLNEDMWNVVLKNTYDRNNPFGQEWKEQVDEIISSIWDTIQVMINTNRTQGYFCTPVLLRYAIKLFNGDYIYQSEPILLGSAGSSYLTNRRMQLTYGFAGTNQFQSKVTFNTKGIHKASIKLDEEFATGNWSDIIESIDVFLSPDIYTPKLYDKFVSMTTTIGTEGERYGTLQLEDAPRNEEQDLLLAASNFYKIASFPIDDLSELSEGYDIEPRNQDDLLTLPRLADDQNSHDTYAGIGESMVYNNRLLHAGYKSTLYEGTPKFFACLNYRGNTIEDSSVTSAYDYFYVFYTKDALGKTHKTKVQIDIPSEVAGLNRGMMGWIVYPNVKCFKVDLIEKMNNNYTAYSYKMEEHPFLNCSYCFLGFGEGIKSGEAISVSDPLTPINNEDASYVDNKTILMSEVDNPFLFPLKYRQTLSGEIISLATTTKALSAGQFGAFPLYAFTEDGIWAMPITEEGLFASASPLSRDVAIKGTVTPVDQAIVFVTDKGVMWLGGSDIVNISPNMYGSHYAIENEIEEILIGTWRLFLPILADRTPFMDFMKNARLGYDYAGDRIIAFNSDHPTYQYVYYLTQKTWHKLGTYACTRIDTILNSYPSLYVSVGVDSTIEGQDIVIYDYSTHLNEIQNSDVGFSNTKPCIVVSRPFDMDLPDVRKCISDIRIRGYFDKTKVHYILLGSSDGRTYGRLNSLRGGSFKFFRIVILAELQDAERISWIDVEYEPRFTNKLR